MHQMTNRELFTTFLPAEKTEALFNHFKGLGTWLEHLMRNFWKLVWTSTTSQVKAVLELSRKHATRTPDQENHQLQGCLYALSSHADLDQEVIRCILLNKRRGILATLLSPWEH